MYRSPFRSKPTMTNPFRKKGNWAAGFHTGEDWVCSDTVLVSPCNGKVSYNAYDANGYGNYIIIHTDDKRCILMAHFRDKSTLNTGQKITAGQRVGIMGSTGNSTGPHLHIEVQDAPEWNYARNLLKPSDYIDFYDFDSPDGDKEEFNVAKTFINKNSRTSVYADSTLKTRIGSLNPKETCECLDIVNDKRLVKYRVDGTTSYKVGFTSETGGVK